MLFELSEAIIHLCFALQSGLFQINSLISLISKTSYITYYMFNVKTRVVNVPGKWSFISGRSSPVDIDANFNADFYVNYGADFDVDPGGPRDPGASLTPQI